MHWQSDKEILTYTNPIFQHTSYEFFPPTGTINPYFNLQPQGCKIFLLVPFFLSFPYFVKEAHKGFY